MNKIAAAMVILFVFAITSGCRIDEVQRAMSLQRAMSQRAPLNPPVDKEAVERAAEELGYEVVERGGKLTVVRKKQKDPPSQNPLFQKVLAVQDKRDPASTFQSQILASQILAQDFVEPIEVDAKAPIQFPLRFSSEIENGTATCFYIDNHKKDRSGEEVLSDVVKIQNAYAELGLQAYGGVSISDEFYHVWLFNAEPIQGELERKLALLLAKKVGVAEYEFFPKQNDILQTAKDEIRESCYKIQSLDGLELVKRTVFGNPEQNDILQTAKDENGNPVTKYSPLHGLELVKQERRTVFWNPEFKPYFLSKVHRHTRAEVEAALAKIESQQH